MTDSMTPGDQARVIVGVAVPPEEAFRVFTQEVDLWWRRGRRFRNAPGEQGIVCIEPGVGGRLFESFSGPVVGRATLDASAARQGLITRRHRAVSVLA